MTDETIARRGPFTVGRIGKQHAVFDDAGELVSVHAKPFEAANSCQILNREVDEQQQREGQESKRIEREQRNQDPTVQRRRAYKKIAASPYLQALRNFFPKGAESGDPNEGQIARDTQASWQSLGKGIREVEQLESQYDEQGRIIGTTVDGRFTPQYRKVKVLVGAPMTVASSDPQLHAVHAEMNAELRKPKGQRQTAKATRANPNAAKHQRDKTRAIGLRQAGKSTKEIAKELQLDRSTVSRYLKGVQIV